MSVMANGAVAVGIRRELDEIASLATSLSQLHRQRDEIDSEIATLETRLQALMSQVSDRDSVQKKDRLAIPGFLDQNRTLLARIVLLLDSAPDDPWTAQEVTDWVTPDEPSIVVAKILNRMAKVGMIRRLGVNPNGLGIYSTLKDRPVTAASNP